jgi:flagellar biogenesis protein FliO
MKRSQRPSHHVVRKGDWLSKIALRYGMSVQEVMSLNGLADDGIDVGSSLRLRGPAAPAQATTTPLATQAASSAPVLGPKEASAEAPEQPLQQPEQAADATDAPVAGASKGLTAKELVGADTSEDNSIAAATGLNQADVGIPTLPAPSVNPLSRARLVLAAALVLLGLLCLHPRTRALIGDRLSGMKLRSVRAGSSEHCIEMHAVRRLGAKQQLLFFEVAGTRLLVGASEGRMDLLHRWDDARAQDRGDETADPVAGERQAATTPSTDPNSTPTRPTAAVEPPQTAKLTPSAEQLLDTWRHSVAEQHSPDAGAGDEHGWWMEGATRFERNRLHGDETGVLAEANSPPGESTGGPQRERVEESILATLRSRRSENNGNGNVHAATRGTRTRPAASHGGFRAAARLGRRTASGLTVATKGQPAASDEQSKTRTGGNLSFRL